TSYHSPIHATPTTHISTLSLHDALPIFLCCRLTICTSDDVMPILYASGVPRSGTSSSFCVSLLRSASAKTGCPLGEQIQRHVPRSEEHTSELQSRFDLVCRLLLEKKKNK